jgi:hypothetical protein
MPPVPWSTKIRVGQNSQNNTYFHNLPGATTPILCRWPVYRVGVH